jgi:hypothetical protein
LEEHVACVITPVKNFNYAGEPREFVGGEHSTLLLHLRVLRLGFLQDGDVGVGVGVFPEREEIFVGGERPDAGGVGIRSLRSLRLQGIGACH